MFINILKMLGGLISLPGNYTQNDERLSRFIAMTVFLFNIFIQLYVIITKTDLSFFIELVSINYGVLLALLGIKGYFETQKVKYEYKQHQVNGDNAGTNCEENNVNTNKNI